ncbi:Hypothetical protein FKW44_022581 [Caligus rogercresseyi]|uniref:Uncharacterized protein n=1 Tax=Caligus rogercresseyi TaxID=217165 RepID=A0A7T8JUJ0_CALRO|nr:Hypothetical protein FKW44_022581 [Caligus rogercresseyi]
MHSPGATAFGNDFIYVFKSEACVYDVQKDSWTRLSSIAIPKNGILECSCLQGYHLPHFLTFPWSLYL